MVCWTKLIKQVNIYFPTTFIYDAYKGAHKGEGVLTGCSPAQTPPQKNLKTKLNFADTMISRVLRDFTLQPKSATEIG
jgi:hypothetical protein